MTAATLVPDPRTRPFGPRGAALTLFYCKDPEILLEGPAGTGKSRTILEKAHLCLLKYPGARILAVRKTRTSMTESVLVTYEQKVLPEGSPIKEGPSRAMRQAYHYPNDSELVIGGMDKADKVMSTEYDMILVFEGTELTEDDHEKLTTRLRNGVMPYQQILVDCNPAGPKHWLNQRAHRRAMTRLLSRHEDNPTVTETYLERLRALTGARRLRLYEGKWAAQEGLVYDEWADANLVDAMPAGWEAWRKVRSIDFGYANPFVCQWWAIDPDGAMYLYREIYKTQTLVEDHARRIRALSEGEAYVVTVADHDAEDRATLEKHGVSTRAADKSITPGIQAVQARIRPAGNGRRRLFIVRDALVEADSLLVEAKRPYSTEQELGEYVWPKDQSGKPQKEAPVDEHNHSMDAMRYAAAFVDPLKQTVSQPRRRSVSMHWG